jgi:hypothetical protein
MLLLLFVVVREQSSQNCSYPCQHGFCLEFHRALIVRAAASFVLCRRGRVKYRLNDYH